MSKRVRPNKQKMQKENKTCRWKMSPTKGAIMSSKRISTLRTVGRDGILATERRPQPGTRTAAGCCTAGLSSLRGGPCHRCDVVVTAESLAVIHWLLTLLLRQITGCHRAASWEVAAVDGCCGRPLLHRPHRPHSSVPRHVTPPRSWLHA